MQAIAVEDEEAALDQMGSLLKEFREIHNVQTFRSPMKALKWLMENGADIAFLDLKMEHISGLTLARQFREACPECKIVFVTGHSHCELLAARMYVSGYLVKPVCREALRRELDYMCDPLPVFREEGRHVRVQCFGRFEVYINGHRTEFERSESKELLAYLIDCKGAFCNMDALYETLWGKWANGAELQNRMEYLVSDLCKGLSNGKEQVLIAQEGVLAVLPEKVECDYYNFLAGDPRAVNTYTGEYMSQYAWAEMTTGTVSVWS